MSFAAHFRVHGLGCGDRTQNDGAVTDGAIKPIEQVRAADYVPTGSLALPEGATERRTLARGVIGVDHERGMSMSAQPWEGNMVRVPQVRRIIFNDEEIGMGFNSQSGLAVGTPLEGFTVQTNPNASGAEVTASITIVNSHEELMESLGMSFEAQGRYGFFSGSAKAKFSENSNYNSTSTFLVARCIVENPLTRGRNFRLTADAKALLDAQRFEEFSKAFGDSFVRGLQTGGEFYSVIRITSASVGKQAELAATLQAEANGLVAAGSFSAAFSQASSSTSTRSEFTATMYQKAGSGAQIAPTVEIGEVIERFKKFPEIARDSAAAYEIEVATYDTLPLPLPTPEEQESFLLALADAREKKLRFIQTRNDLDFALRNPSFFDGLPASDVLSEASAAYTKLINAVLSHAIRLSRGQITPPQLFDPSALSPPLSEPAPIPLKRVSPPPLSPTVEVPDLTRGGIRVPAVAHAHLHQRGLEFRDSGPTELVVGGKLFKGVVVGQDPAAGSVVSVGTVIFLQIGDFKEVIPVGGGGG